MKYFLCLLIFFSCQLESYSQWSHRKYPYIFGEVGVTGGLTNYLGDLSTVSFDTKQLNLAGGVTARVTPYRFLSLRSSLFVGTISGDDKTASMQAKDPSVRSALALRNLSFRTRICELNIIPEINLIGFQPIMHKHKFSPSLFTGLALFYFNPKAYYDGRWVALQPLGTEGQGAPGYGKKYARIQPAIPFGGSLKYGFKDKKDNYFTITGEIGIRKTFTDYLDDVSRDAFLPYDVLKAANGELAADISIRADEVDPRFQKESNYLERRGNPNTKDWYFYTGLSFCMVLYDHNYEFIYHKIPKRRW